MANGITPSFIAGRSIGIGDTSDPNAFQGIGSIVGGAIGGPIGSGIGGVLGGGFGRAFGGGDIDRNIGLTAFGGGGTPFLFQPGGSLASFRTAAGDLRARGSEVSRVAGQIAIQSANLFGADRELKFPVTINGQEARTFGDLGRIANALPTGGDSPALANAATQRSAAIIQQIFAVINREAVQPGFTHRGLSGIDLLDSFNRHFESQKAERELFDPDGAVADLRVRERGFESEVARLNREGISSLTREQLAQGEPAERAEGIALSEARRKREEGIQEFRRTAGANQPLPPHLTGAIGTVFTGGDAPGVRQLKEQFERDPGIVGAREIRTNAEATIARNNLVDRSARSFLKQNPFGTGGIGSFSKQTLGTLRRLGLDDTGINAILRSQTGGKFTAPNLTPDTVVPSIGGFEAPSITPTQPAQEAPTTTTTSPIFRRSSFLTSANLAPLAGSLINTLRGRF